MKSTASPPQSETLTPQHRLIVVLGMHRSGSSAISRALQVLGVDLGDNLMPPVTENNENGFWNDIDVVHFNTELLKALDSDWHRLSPFTPDDLERLRQRGFYFKALELLGRKTRRRPIFGMEDPRVAKLLPFWQAVFAHSGCRIGYVLTSRHPLSVAQSLALRDGFEPEKSYFLWLDHVLSSLARTTGSQRLLVDYDRLMQAPERELQRMADRLELELDPRELRLYLDHFIDKRFRHAVYTAGTLSFDDSCPPLVREVHLALTEAAADHITLDDSALQRQFLLWRQELERLVSPLRFMDKQDAKLTVAAQSISDRDKAIAGLRQTAAERQERIDRLNEALSQNKDQIARLETAMTERDGRITHLQHALAAANAEVSRLEARAFEKDQRLVQLDRTLAERDRELAELGQALAERDHELAFVYQSKSWTVTAPLRCFRRNLITNTYQTLRKGLSGITDWFWYSLPLPVNCKLQMQDVLFRNLPTLLGWTKAYQDWRDGDSGFDLACPPGQNAFLPALDARKRTEVGSYVPLLKGLPLADKPARLICFYSPQFHSVPENNAGSLAEWSAIRSASPLFVGHDQPHVPMDELGGYQLITPSVLSRQIALARLYGIDGFCFHYRWPDGNDLSEAPIQHYLDDRSLDLPFCLCWTNDPGHRHRPGMDKAIFAEDHHNEKDDIAFIRHISRYLSDSRYLRIDGKPVLLLQRPDLLPSARNTSEKWRQWCRDNKIGDIFLIYAQSFERVAPAVYGLDAAVEMPPNGFQLAEITEKIHLLNPESACRVYDWKKFVVLSRNYQRAKYTVFRGLCPSWDNTAMQQTENSVFINSSPRGFQQWLVNAISDTTKRFIHPGQRLLFINAWNAWAEGAHLEPDLRYGYAYLEACRMALVRSSLLEQSQIKIRDRTIAVVIHAFYEDVFDEILDYLKDVHSVPLKLYVTTPSHLVESIKRKLATTALGFFVLPVANRGRDILPFLKIMPEVLLGGHEFLIKVHTKKSRHRQDGESWRNDMYENLLPERAISVNIDYLAKHPKTGLLGPSGHIVPMSLYWGANAVRATQLAARLGVDGHTLKHLNFVAGTMFMARIRAIIPLLNIALSEDDFESETGQLDGTMAHALERVFSASAFSAGLSVGCRKGKPSKHYKFVN